MERRTPSARLGVLARQLAGPHADGPAQLSRNDTAGSGTADEARPAPGGGRGTLTVLDNRTGKKYTVSGVLHSAAACGDGMEGRQGTAMQPGNCHCRPRILHANLSHNPFESCIMLLLGIPFPGVCSLSATAAGAGSLPIRTQSNTPCPTTHDEQKPTYLPCSWRSLRGARSTLRR